MGKPSGRVGAIREVAPAAIVLIAIALFPIPIRADAESPITGRLTDTRGVALAGATILVFPAAGMGPGAEACTQVRTDPDGGFVAFLPPGRYLVAAVKQGYDVSLTEVHSLASRVLRMRAEPSRGGEARRPRTGLDLDWILRGDRDDILRAETPAIPPALLLAEEKAPASGAAPAGEAGPGAADRVASARATGRDLFGAVDGEFLQSVGAGELPGLGAGAAADSDRATNLDLHAPVNDHLAWDFAGATTRSDVMADADGAPIGGGVDRLLAGVIYMPAAGGRLGGAVHTGVGRGLAGSASTDDRLLVAEGVYRAESGDPLEIGLRTWSTRIDPGDGRYMTLTNPAAGALEASGESGVSLYAGSSHQFGPRTALRYGVEYLDRGALGRSAVPRVAMRRSIDGGADLAVEGEILIHPDHPGGRMALACTPGQGLRMTAAIFVLPEYETAAAAGGGAPIGAVLAGAGGIPAVDPVGATRSAVDLSFARDFGPLAGHLAGGVGRTGARSTPAIDPGPLPLVSAGPERYYETRLGVAWKPWKTEMQVGYRRVEAEPGGDPGAASSADYRRVDLMLAQTLPSPRALLGAELRALVAWQEVTYDGFIAGAGSSTSGLASRLTGGVGLSF